MLGKTERAKKRFIAGAVCPSCKTQDSVYVALMPDGEQVACVSCDYLELKEAPKDEPQAQKAQNFVAKDQNVIGLFQPE